MEINFSTFVKMYYSQAMVYLGKIENPATNKFEKNLEQADILISILTTIKSKTKNNLNNDEEELLNQALTQMKLGYTESTN